MTDVLEVLSLGAGVQSSTMALMASLGELAPMPDAGIFADTQAEPAVVYEWLAQLRKLLPYEIHVVTTGNLEHDVLRMLGGDAERSRCGQPPFYVRNPNSNDRGGTLWRQCTQDYKLQPIKREARRLMEATGKRRVRQWIGISLDEVHRMKQSRVDYIENVYPLVDLRMTRWDCERWLREHGYANVPKSACRWCPYISNRRWRDMKLNQPVEFAKAVEFDRALRAQRNDKINGVKITGELFVHRSMMPLDQVDFSTDVDRGQGELFGNECEGMCGV